MISSTYREEEGSSQHPEVGRGERTNSVNSEEEGGGLGSNQEGVWEGLCPLKVWNEWFAWKETAY